ncbi:MAG: acetylglutamate kinase [Myxococcales bacterium]|nr:acetylglutamate kinase [Myxococcales bacterium]
MSTAKTIRGARRRVLKVGGAHLADERYLDALASRLSELRAEGSAVLLVHGGGAEIAALHQALGVPFEKRRGLRVTSERGMDIVTMVLCGLVNKRLVARFVAAGLSTIGLSGVDLGLMRAKLLNYEQLGRVGAAPVVDVARLAALLDEHGLVVMAPTCAGPDGMPVNVNADAVAQALAVAIEAETLEMITDVDAVRTERGPARQLRLGDVEALIAGSVIKGGMIPKVQAALAAVGGGVERVRVGSLESLARGEATEVRA